MLHINILARYVLVASVAIAALRYRSLSCSPYAIANFAVAHRGKPSAYRSPDPVVAISFMTMITWPSLTTSAEPATNHMIEQIVSQWQSDGLHAS
jgi:hypothetical protein